MTSRRRLVLIACLGSLLMPAHAKTGRSWYTDTKLATMRANLAAGGWARKLRDTALASATAWAQRDDAFLRAMVIPPQVPRAYDIHNLGCPVHGSEANKGGLYRWGYSLDRPFKITCPAGGEEYPSNDFAAFLASGLKDRALLTGQFADDGWGWNRPPEKHNYWFVAYYAHWSMQRELQGAIGALSLGALLSDDPAQARRFAHKCALLLWQLAAYYPDYDYLTQARESREHNPTYSGRITNMIWEVGWADVCAPAYDAIWPFLAEDRELQALAGLDGPGLDTFLRDRLLLTMARDITSGNGRNRGNYGMHQRALVRLARALDEQTASPTSRQMIDWVLANPRPRVEADMGLLDALESQLYRDGMPPESPAYNAGWTTNIAEIAALFGDQGEGLTDHPHFHGLLQWQYELCLAGRFHPPLGDSGDLFARASPPADVVRRLAVEHLGDPRAAADLRRGGGQPVDLFTPAAASLRAALPAPAAPPAPGSRLFPAYGLGLLEAGPDQPAAVVLHYGSWIHHRHRDQLNLLLFAHDNALLCDVGYPEQTDAFNHRRTGIWDNTIAHNTVTVNARGQGRGPGVLHAFQPHGFAQVVDASAAAYAEVDLYRRAVMLVSAGPGRRYVFDVFHVRGGTQHDWALMGPPAEFTCDPPLGPPQQQGTLAGPDIPYEQFYDDPELKDKPLGTVSYGRYRGSGFQFFVQVQRAPLQERVVADWRLTAPLPGQPERPWQGIGVRTHLVGENEEIIAADCQPQRYRYLPPWIRHLIRRRIGSDLRSAFVSVHEPYAGEHWIEAVTALPVQPADGESAAVRVRLRDGTEQLCFHSLRADREHLVDGQFQITGQAACVALDRAGRPIRAMLLNGTRLRLRGLDLNGPGLRSTRIARVDYAARAIDLAHPAPGPAPAPGQTLIVRTPGGSEAVTVRRVVSPTRIELADRSLIVAGGPVTGVDPEHGRLSTSLSHLPHAYPHLTVINGRGEVQGRLAQGEPVALDRTGLPPLTLECFPARSPGLGRRFAIAIAGPGDEVLLPSLTLYGDGPEGP